MKTQSPTLHGINGKNTRQAAWTEPNAPAPLPIPANDLAGVEILGRTEAPSRKMNAKAILVRLVLIVALIALGVGATKAAWNWWVTGRFIESTDDAYIGGDITAIAPKVAGFISAIEVIDNQPVHAGDLLIKLDDRDFRAALAKAEAAVAMEQASLSNLEAGSRLQQAYIAQAKAGIAASDAERTRAQDDQVRAKNLLSQGVESPQEFQKADADSKKAVAEGEKTRAALMAAERQLEVIATQKQQARAAFDAAIAERDLARLNLSYTEVRAPADGTVGNRSAKIGAYANPGGQLLSLVPTRGLWVDANFKENQLKDIHPGAPAQVKVDLLGGKPLKGHVVSIAPATGAQFSVLPTENATGNFTKIVQRIPVRIVLDEEALAEGQMRPGLSVTAKVNTRGTLWK